MECGFGFGFRFESFWWEGWVPARLRGVFMVFNLPEPPRLGRIMAQHLKGPLLGLGLRVRLGPAVKPPYSTRL